MRIIKKILYLHKKFDVTAITLMFIMKVFSASRIDIYHSKTRY